jgi:hypothetical protein
MGGSVVRRARTQTAFESCVRAKLFLYCAADIRRSVVALGLFAVQHFLRVFPQPQSIPKSVSLVEIDLLRKQNPSDLS